MTLQGNLYILKDFLAKLLRFQKTPIEVVTFAFLDCSFADVSLQKGGAMCGISEEISAGSKENLPKHLDFYVIRDEFVRRLDRFVKNFKGEKVDSFTVDYYLDSQHSSNIDQWTRFAMSNGVGRLALLLRGGALEYDTCYEFSFDLSFEYCNNSRLKHIYLRHCFVHNPVNFDILTFANSRSLVLLASEVDAVFLTTLLSNCLQFEELKLIQCWFNNSLTIQVESSSLCHFKLDRSWNIVNDVYIQLTSLECLKLTSLYVDNLCNPTNNRPRLKSSINAPRLKSIHHVELLLVETLHQAFADFATFPKLEILNLHISNYSPTTTPPVLQGIQTLKNLRELNLSVDTRHVVKFGFGWILSMVHACPLLQKLRIMMRYGYNRWFYDHANQNYIQDLKRFSHDEIKVIELEGCKGNLCEIEFTLHALKYIHKLERIVLNPYWTDTWFDQERKSDRIWLESGRENILKKLQDEGIELDRLVLM